MQQFSSHRLECFTLNQVVPNSTLQQLCRVLLTILHQVQPIGVIAQPQNTDIDTEQYHNDPIRN